MGQVLGQLVLLALTAALSMVPITTTIFILLSDHRQAIALPFLAGWVIGTAATLTLATLTTYALPGAQRQKAAVIDALQIPVGCALVVVGVVSLVRQLRTPTSGRPKWIDGITSFGRLPVFGIGLALNVRPKALLLFTAASLAISRAGLDADETLVAIAFYTVLATSTVVAPILATLLFPAWMAPRLAAARDWVTAHGATVTAVILIVIGLLIAGIGLSD